MISPTTVPLVRPEAAARPTAGALFALLDQIHQAGAFESGSQHTPAEERLRRKDERTALEAAEIAAAELRQPTAADLTRQDERDVAVGSRAFKRQAGREALQRDAQSGKQAFRDALRAGQRELNAARPTSPQAPAAKSTAPTSDAAPGRPAAIPATEAPASAASVADSAKADGVSRNASPGVAGKDPSAGGPSSSPAAEQRLLPANPAGPSAARAPSPPIAAAALPPPSLPLAMAATSPQTAESAATPNNAGAAARPLNAPASAESRAPRPLAPGNDAARNTANADDPNRAENAERSARIDRIVKAMHAQYREEGGTLKLRLDPPALGEIRVEMQVHKGEVTLLIDTQNDLAHRLLSEDADALRDGLEAGGLKLERFELRPPAPGPDGSGPDLSRGQPDARDSRDAPGRSNAERSSDSGTDATLSTAPAEDGPVGGSGRATLAAETRVNVLA